MLIQLKRIDGSLIHAGEYESLRHAVEYCVRNGISLAHANLEGANLAPSRHREIYAVEHHYLCGGYWLAERIPDHITEVANQGVMVPNNGKFYLRLSGKNEVLSQNLVELRMNCCRERGEVVDLCYIHALPEGSVVH